VKEVTPALTVLWKVHQPGRAVCQILTLAVWRLDCSSNSLDNIIYAHTPLQSHTHTHTQSEWRVCNFWELARERVSAKASRRHRARARERSQERVPAFKAKLQGAWIRMFAIVDFVV